MTPYPPRRRWSVWQVAFVLLIVLAMIVGLALVYRLTEPGPATGDRGDLPAASTPSASNSITIPSATPAVTPAPTSPQQPPPTPAATSAPTSARTPAPTPAPTSPSRPNDPPAARPPIRHDALARVVTDDLRVRSKPGVSDDSIKLEPLLWDGALVWVMDGPVAASGYEWYLVNPLGEVDLQLHPDPPRIGWVAAAGKDGEQWLAEEPIDCPATPFDLLSELDYPSADQLALACFGSAPIRFTALVSRPEATCGTEPPWRTEPTWLGGCDVPFVLADPEPDYPVGLLALYPAVDPDLDLSGLEIPESGSWLVVDVTGQRDHAAAQTCRAVRSYPSGEAEPDPRLVVRDCRAQLVVTSIAAHVDR